ncbi:hypothetical protein BDZ45DRAFT_800323 [Acephala macrosclerotiorum]|nr:hypothetical protein BDZ45DRAFT_800323 [Acephala macrosclerotiorum]
MALSLKAKTTIIQFVLIIVISSIIAGTVGGVTSQINKWNAAKVVQAAPTLALNATTRTIGTDSDLILGTDQIFAASRRQIIRLSVRHSEDPPVAEIFASLSEASMKQKVFAGTRKGMCTEIRGWWGCEL